MNIDIIVVHYGELSRTLECVESYVLAAKKFVNVVDSKIGICIVDNSNNLGSSFGQYASVRVDILKPARNLGFAGGICLATRMLSNADFFIFSNNDLVVSEDLLLELWKAYSLLPNAGALQPCVLGYDVNVDSLGCTSNPLMFSLNYSNWPIKPIRKLHLDGCSAIEVYGVEGMVIFVSKQNWFRYGQWDPDFFMFCEDLLLSWKLRVAGLKNYVAQEAIVRHIRGGSAEGRFIKKNPIFPSYYTSRNRLLSILYLYDAKWLLEYFPLALISELAKNLFLTLHRRDVSHISYYLKGIAFILRNPAHVKCQRSKVTRLESPEDFMKKGAILSFRKWFKLILEKRSAVLSE